MLISKIISQWSYRAWGDAQEVRIERKLGEQGELRIINIYNPIGYIDMIVKLEGIHGKQGPAALYWEISISITQPGDAKADALIELTNSADLDLCLAPGTITRDESSHQTAIDLVFGSHDPSEGFLAS
ncbi:uncharacterized protein N7446_011972 [Penicillium canescens]|uniref:uncharacterized protein n=1 Tax=Penicillium canescens TaxID=5083 RepID=UPI0026DF0D45|nr:uncharacterized protein N7446_011972 [Penicillium canescens]KAJ6047138.1 hypothetical protein N7446_011972 [Penicillium canescens]